MKQKQNFFSIVGYILIQHLFLSLITCHFHHSEQLERNNENSKAH